MQTLSDSGVGQHRYLHTTSAPLTTCRVDSIAWCDVSSVLGTDVCLWRTGKDRHFLELLVELKKLLSGKTRTSDEFPHVAWGNVLCGVDNY